MALVKPW